MQKEIKEISYKQRRGNWFLKAHLKVLKGSLCRMQGVICIRITSVSYQILMCHLELQSKMESFAYYRAAECIDTLRR